jgi:exonuclease SbcD
MSATLILGDCHLGRSLSLGKTGIGNTLNSRITDQFNILSWILTRAIEHDVGRIICTGDIFHEPKPSSTLITMFMEWLKQISDANIDIDILVGNHDLIRVGQTYYSSLDIISAADIQNVAVHKNTSTVHSNGASFTLMPFRDRRSLNASSQAEAIQALKQFMPYEMASIHRDNAKIMVGHLTIEGSLYVGDEIDDVQNEIFCPLDMFSEYDYTWNGHIHKPQILMGTPHIAHVGSMDLSDFGETDHTKIAVIFDTEKSDPVKYLELPTRPLNQISVNVPDNIVDTTSFVIEQIKSQHKTLSKSIIKLNISLDNPDVSNVDRAKVEACLNDLGTFHISRIVEERKITQVKKTAANEGLDNTVNELTAIKMYATSMIEEEMRNDFIVAANNVVKECV